MKKEYNIIMENPYVITDLILKKKDRAAIEAYSGDPESLPIFIICKLLSRNGGCHQEALINTLGLISLTQIDKSSACQLLSTITPKVKNSMCLKW